MSKVCRGLRIGCGVAVLGLCVGTTPSTAQMLSESDKSALQEYLRKEPASDASTRAPVQAPDAPVSTPAPLSRSTDIPSRQPQPTTDTTAPSALSVDDAPISESMANQMADSEMRLRELLNGNAERHKQLQQSLSAMQIRHQVLRQQASSILWEILP